MRKIIAVVATLALLNGCASPATQNALTMSQQACIGGNPDACAAIPNIQAQANVEAQVNGNTAAHVALALILLPLLILGASR